MKNKIGIIQGRLSPKPGERFQFLPFGWEDELARIRALGFDSVEWLADWHDWEENPLITGEGIPRVKQAADRHCVHIGSVCADYFMKRSFLGSDADDARTTLKTIIRNARMLAEVPIITVPFLEDYPLAKNSEKEEALVHLKKVLEETKGIPFRIALETELTARELLDFLARANDDRLGVCYDMGNCTSYGFDCPKDIQMLSSHIFDVHVKDRRVGNVESMPFGTGDTDFRGCFAALRRGAYSGPLILEAWRSAAYIEDARRQLLFVQNLLNRHP